ncbi:MAG: DUF362 domain-containing protein [bacterium]
MAVFQIKSVADYRNHSVLKNFVTDFLQSINKVNLQGKRVLVKPNFLKPSFPEKAIITHPLLLTAVIEALKDSGAQIYLGDSPGFGTLEAVIKKSGLFPVISRYDVRLADFSRPVNVKPKDTLIFRDFELPAILFECDEIVNVPKLKTHQMMVLTLAVKNLYGCIYGTKKIKFHLTAGENHDIFATFLLDLYLTIKPSVNILDGIVGMEGEGPSSGDIRNFGFLVASDDALVTDYKVTKLLGLKPEKVPILKMALKNKLLLDREIVELNRYFELDSRVPLKLPRSQAVNFSVPKILNRIAKRFIFSYPKVVEHCKGCGVCLKHCPVSAIRIKNSLATIDKAKCIRCFCCQELCEHNAISVR